MVYDYFGAAQTADKFAADSRNKAEAAEAAGELVIAAAIRKSATSFDDLAATIRKAAQSS